MLSDLSINGEGRGKQLDATALVVLESLGGRRPMPSSGLLTTEMVMMNVLIISSKTQCLVGELSR